MKLTISEFGEYKGNPTKLYEVEDEATNFYVAISDFGATLVRVKVPDREGKSEDINFGQNSPQEFVEHNSYLGAVVGRIANRIANGVFELEGKTYTLAKNLNNKHHLHGGIEGFNYKTWKLISKKEENEECTLVFEYTSPDGEEGYPGTLTVTVEYIIRPMQIEWIFRAKTDKTTIINMTNHAYWNLDGLETLIDDQLISIDADKYMPVDEDGLVTGEIVSVEENRNADFRKPRKFSEIFSTFGDIDNNFFLNGYKGELNAHPQTKELHFAGDLFSPKTGRYMKVETTEPCLQVYTGNFMEGVKSFDITCKKHSAVCFETQRVPNAINLEEFKKMVILKPREEYYHRTRHVFEVRN